MKKLFLSAAILGFSTFLSADYNHQGNPSYYDQNPQGGRANRNQAYQSQNQSQPQGQGYYQQNPGANQNYYQGGGSCPNCPNNPGYNPNYTGYSNDRNPANPYYETRSPGQRDRELEQRIRDELRGGWFSKGYEQISANVQGGVVTLRGFVITWDDKDALEKRIRNIEGVSNLNSQISVRSDSDKDQDQETDTRSKEQKEFPQDRAATPADKQLNAKIRDNVSSGWLWDSYKYIQLNTNNGMVVIEGYVASTDDEKKLLNEIRKIEGVRGINSNVNIKK